MADKKKEKSEIFPFLEWENLFLYMFSTTADYETAQKSRTITLKLTWSALTNIRTYKAKTHSHVRVKGVARSYLFLWELFRELQLWDRSETFHGCRADLVGELPFFKF